MKKEKFVILYKSRKKYDIKLSGKVYSLKSRKFLSQHITNTGHYIVKICYKGKEYCYTLADLVLFRAGLLTYENCNKVRARHKNRYKLNCHIDNLELISKRKENLLSGSGEIIKKYWKEKDIKLRNRR